MTGAMKARLRRAVLIAVAMLAWYATQAWLAHRLPSPGACVGDAVHRWTQPLNDWFGTHARAADSLLIASSAIIDGLGLFLLGWGLWGASARPIVELVTLFGLRQIAQALVALPAPAGMIWHDPGFPTIFVTYGVSTDFFFSGHTAIAVLGAIELARWKPRPFAFAGFLIPLFEVATVLILHSHYTMDVIAGAAMAGLVAVIVPRFLNVELDGGREPAATSLGGLKKGQS